MTGTERSHARGIVLLLAGALIACAAVVYALVRVTGPATGSGPGAPTSLPTTSVPTQLLSSGDARSRGSGADATPGGPTSAPGQSTDAPSSTSNDASGQQTATVPPSTTMDLPGAHVPLPAAWTGTAKVTVTVVGDCAKPTPSVYTALPADLALDLAQNEANAAEVGLPHGVSGKDVALTLGINASGVPSLAVYSSQIDASGAFQRYWNLGLSPGPGRSDVNGTLINQSAAGSNPNLMVDAETSLQPCESAGTVSLPRALAQGSTMTGWVSATAAQLTVRATTTDGKRAVTVVVDLARKH